MNINGYNLGINSNGEVIDDVELPPWAKGSAREFIRLHRCPEYVSVGLIDIMTLFAELR
jgi:hypothetical protein